MLLLYRSGQEAEGRRSPGAAGTAAAGPAGTGRGGCNPAPAAPAAGCRLRGARSASKLSPPLPAPGAPRPHHPLHCHPPPPSSPGHVRSAARAKGRTRWHKWAHRRSAVSRALPNPREAVHRVQPAGPPQAAVHAGAPLHRSACLAALPTSASPRHGPKPHSRKWSESSSCIKPSAGRWAD